MNENLWHLSHFSIDHGLREGNFVSFGHKIVTVFNLANFLNAFSSGVVWKIGFPCVGDDLISDGSSQSPSFRYKPWALEVFYVFHFAYSWIFLSHLICLLTKQQATILTYTYWKNPGPLRGYSALKMKRKWFFIQLKWNLNRRSIQGYKMILLR